MIELSLATIAEYVGGECSTAANTAISGIASIDRIEAGKLVFVNSEQRLKQLAQSELTAVMIKPQWRDSVTVPAILVADPYHAYALASQLFTTRPALQAGIHPAAVIDASATVAASAQIGAGAVIGANCQIGEDCFIGPNTVVGEASRIGAGTRIFANATIYHEVLIGANCEIASGTVIGSDGFGFAPSSSGWQAIAQNGGVLIGDSVYIGANTTVDRGAIEPTILADGVIIDNQVQIAHNVVVGENTAIAGCVGIAGSTRIGKNCLIAGGAGIVGHIDICDGVTVSACTRVTKSIREPGEYASGTPFMKIADWRKAAAKFSRSIKKR